MTDVLDTTEWPAAAAAMAEARDLDEALDYRRRLRALANCMPSTRYRIESVGVEMPDFGGKTCTVDLFDVKDEAGKAIGCVYDGPSAMLVTELSPAAVNRLLDDFEDQDLRTLELERENARLRSELDGLRAATSEASRKLRGVYAAARAAQGAGARFWRRLRAFAEVCSVLEVW